MIEVNVLQDHPFLSLKKQYWKRKASPVSMFRMLNGKSTYSVRVTTDKKNYTKSRH